MSDKIDVLKIDKNMAINSLDASGLVWLDPSQKPFKLIGFNWFEQDKVYRRFPVNPDPSLPEAVEKLSNFTAGGQIKFRTDSKRIAIKVKLLSCSMMDNMANTGSNGFDLYIGQVFYSTARGQINEETFVYEFPELESSSVREFTLNFPLYNGVEELSIALEQGASLAAPAPFVDDRPIIVYGTSIAQGGCAARPGMCYTNILSRKLNRPFINLAFSGSGKGEPEVAEHIANINNPAMFILDYEPNVLANRMAETLPGFINILRRKHPLIPILVVSNVPYTRELFCKRVKKNREDCKRIEQENVKRCQAAGDNNIYFVDAESFQGEDFWECTVDGIHPTDLGFYRMAENFLPQIEKILLMAMEEK